MSCSLGAVYPPCVFRKGLLLVQSSLSSPLIGQKTLVSTSLVLGLYMLLT